ncbi:MAG: peptidylprolyl isomerase [Rhodospirillales bacterium]|nr:peptidylprolyl isomerase [Rhodospirillales bacterium]
MMRKLLLTVLVCGFAAIGNAVFAQETQKIAAVVNDEVISLYDLQSRLSLLIAGSDTTDTPETRRRLAPEVLRRMIDEVLQLQEAKRLSITVADPEVEQAMANIERQNGMPKGGLETFLARNGIDKLALVNQVEPQIAWSKVVGRRIRPQIQISPEEVSETLARIKAGVGKPEYLLAEIFLRVDDTENEAQIRQVAQRIMQQLQQGANFAAVARNFSQAASAAEGGNLGWVRAEELGEDLSAPVSQMQPGQVAGPIRTLSGFQIILLRERRLAAGVSGGDAEVQLQQLFFPLAANAPAAQVADATAKAQSTAARARSCGDMEALARELATPMSGSLGKLKASALPAAVQNAIRDLEIGRPSAPVRTESGLAVLMVCARQGQNAEQDQRQQIERMLTLQRLDAAAQRYLRDLRRAAFIDIRL